jgi:hypothetical protein
MYKVRPEEYLRNFSGDAAPPNLRRAALEEARENRKFEIDLYWRRAAYFWVFIAAAFGGYSTLQGDRQTIAFLVACLGFIFSLAWYFVNRGSKFWQQNWELHVDLLEDDFAGPIYKTVVQRKQCRFRDLTGAYPFSVSKINQLLSLFVTVVWLTLIARSFFVVWDIQCSLPPHLATILMSVCTLAAAIVLACFGRTGDLEANTHIDHLYQSKRFYD